MGGLVGGLVGGLGSHPFGALQQGLLVPPLMDTTSVAELQAGKGASAAPPPGGRPCSQSCVACLKPVTESQLRAMRTSHESKAVVRTHFHEYRTWGGVCESVPVATCDATQFCNRSDACSGEKGHLCPWLCCLPSSMSSAWDCTTGRPGSHSHPQRDCQGCWEAP